MGYIALVFILTSAYFAFFVYQTVKSKLKVPVVLNLVGAFFGFSGLLLMLGWIANKVGVFTDGISIGPLPPEVKGWQIIAYFALCIG